MENKTKSNLLVKALYIHIPFCDHICIYCDFYKMIGSPTKQDKYVDYLVKEIDLRKEYLSSIETIYVGGGTPSNLSINNIKKLFDKLSEYIDLSKLKEFTFECNPNDVSIELLNTLKSYYVNRISLGVQSFNNDKLTFLRRNHTKDIAINAIRLIKEVGFSKISCDLIYGLDFDSVDLIKKDLDTLINENVTHISCYTLIIEDKTILNHFIHFDYKPLSDDKEAEIFGFVNDYLRKFGYNHYEVSNYALPTHESIHNLHYWDLDEYIGIGANASGFIYHTHYTNINNLDKYYEGIDKMNLCYKEENTLTKSEEMDEYLMVGFRKLEGISKNIFKNRFNCDIIKEYPNIINLINQGYLEETKENIKIREDYIYLMDNILLKIFN